MEPLNERHSFIVAGIFREAFQEIAVRATVEDDTLSWYLHAHNHDPYGAAECNERCQVVRSGKVEYVTHSDVANPQRVRVE